MFIINRKGMTTLEIITLTLGIAVLAVLAGMAYYRGVEDVANSVDVNLTKIPIFPETNP